MEEPSPTKKPKVVASSTKSRGKKTSSKIKPWPVCTPATCPKKPQNNGDKTVEHKGLFHNLSAVPWSAVDEAAWSNEKAFLLARTALDPANVDVVATSALSFAVALVLAPSSGAI